MGIFFGPGWYYFMFTAVKRYSLLVMWFFIFYFFVVGVLFGQLIIGIILGVFLDSQELWGDGGFGQVMIVTKAKMPFMSKDAIKAMLIDIGCMLSLFQVEQIMRP